MSTACTVIVTSSASSILVPSSTSAIVVATLATASFVMVRLTRPGRGSLDIEGCILIASIDSSLSLATLILCKLNEVVKWCVLREHRLQD
jgi:hypothetical protein